MLPVGIDGGIGDGMETLGEQGGEGESRLGGAVRSGDGDGVVQRGLGKAPSGTSTVS